MKSIRTLADYVNFVRKTDKLPPDDLGPVLHGLFGEVGGLMTAAKKLKREPNAYTAFNSVAIEEFGDAFWYLCCLALRLDLDIDSIFLSLAENNKESPDIFIGSMGSPLSVAYQPNLDENFDSTLVSLGQLTGNFLSAGYIQENSANKVSAFLKTFFTTVALLKLDFAVIIESNTRKVSSRFIRPNNDDLPTFDDGFEDFERLPDTFEIEYVKRTKTQQALRWNGVFIGDPLTDSIMDTDGYRFHDVFHFSHASIMHWSPAFRSLIKHKRKSDPDIDRNQDGGRAIVVEEGLSAWVFNIAKENHYFEGRKGVTFDMLKNIDQIVKGFEVDVCPLILWEEAILKGYEVFRKVAKNEGGTVTGNRKNRALTYKES